MSQCHLLQQFAKLNRELKQWQHALNERVRKYIFIHYFNCLKCFQWNFCKLHTYSSELHNFFRVGHVSGYVCREWDTFASRT